MDAPVLIENKCGMVRGAAEPEVVTLAVLDLIALDAGLEALARLSPQQSRIVELRFFAGLSIEETGEVLGVSPSTVKRDWAIAKAWLYRETRR